jgi:hypothetical protein
MLTLAKAEVPPLIKVNLTCMLRDMLVLSKLTPAQTRDVYSEIENIRDALSILLDKADRK